MYIKNHGVSIASHSNNPRLRGHRILRTSVFSSFPVHGDCFGPVPCLVIPEADVTWCTVVLAKAGNADDMPLGQARLL